MVDIQLVDRRDTTVTAVFDKSPVMTGTLCVVHLPDFEVIRGEMVELSLHPFLIASGGRRFEDRKPTGKTFVLSCPRIQQ